MTAENEPNSWKGVIESNQEIEWPDYFKNRQEWTHFLRKCNPVPSKEIGRIFHDQTRRKFHLEGSHQFPSTKGIGRIFHDRMRRKLHLGGESSIPINKGNRQIISWPDGNEPNSWKGVINSHQQSEWADYSMTGREWNEFFEWYHQFPSTKKIGRIFHYQTRIIPVLGKEAINSHQQRELPDYFMTGREWNQFF